MFALLLFSVLWLFAIGVVCVNVIVGVVGSVGVPGIIYVVVLLPLLRFYKCLCCLCCCCFCCCSCFSWSCLCWFLLLSVQGVGVVLVVMVGVVWYSDETI